ncbi:hypothetical protein D9M71_156520 [compost metagenome]
MRVESIEVSVARQHQHIGANTTALGGHHKPVALLGIAQRLALLVDAATGPLDRIRKAQGQFQRIQMPALGIEQAGLITLAGNPLRQIAALDKLQFVVAPLVARLVLPLGQQAYPTGHHRGPEMTGAIVAIELMAAGQVTQLARGPAHAVPQAPRPFVTQRRFQRWHVARPAENRLAAITPGRGPGHPAGFEQGHALAGQRQTQSRVQSTEPGPDDQHFGVLFTFQCSSIDQTIGAGMGVVTGDMPGGLLKHTAS